MQLTNCLLIHSGWQDATDECNTNPDALPCPLMVTETGLNVPLECPSGLMCFTIGMSCTPVTEPPTDVPTLMPSSAAPTTYAPSSAPIAADDEVNLYFCGSDLEEANELCGQWCRSGLNTDCPKGQKCFKNTACNATELNFTIDYDAGLISDVPSIAPTTYKPTEDQNPSDYYCFDGWTDASYDGDCGLPCPSGLNTECPNGQVRTICTISLSMQTISLLTILNQSLLHIIVLLWTHSRLQPCLQGWCH